MISAVSLARARVLWASRACGSDQSQPRSAQKPIVSYEPKRIEHFDEGCDTPRTEAWFVHHYQPDGVLKRTLIVASIELQLLLQKARKSELDEVNLRQMVLQPKYQGWTIGRALLEFEKLSKEALRDGFERIDEARENRRPRRYVAAEAPSDLDAALLEADEAPLGGLLETEEAVQAEAREPAPALGTKAVSKPHPRDQLRGRFVRCIPYRGEEVGKTIDPMEQWIAVVDTDFGQFHLVAVDLKRAIEVIDARKDDVIRIVARNSQAPKAEVNITEERHGTHGEGTHKSTIVREEVYDAYIEKRASSFVNARRKDAASKAETVVITDPLPEALRDIKPEGEVLREVLRHIKARPITGWTKIIVAEQPQVHARLLSCSLEDHQVIFVKGNECVARHVYPEALESVRRRVQLRLPDLVIQPA